MHRPLAQELNAPILELARHRGRLADKDLHWLLAVGLGTAPSGQAIASVDQMLFSVSVNLAKRRLVRYGLLEVDSRNRISITAQGELFLARGFTRLDAGVRRLLDEAWLDLATAADSETIDDDDELAAGDPAHADAALWARLDELEAAFNRSS